MSDRKMSDQRKLILAIWGVIHTILLSLTLRDLSHRPEAAVRGPKRLWRSWAALNTTGSIAYWTIGRRRTKGSVVETTVVEVVE